MYLPHGRDLCSLVERLQLQCGISSPDELRVRRVPRWDIEYRKLDVYVLVDSLHLLQQ